MAASQSLHVYSLQNYSFGSKDPTTKKKLPTEARMKKMEQKFAAEGLLRRVEGVMIVHQHNHAHILLLQDRDETFSLPGGRLQTGEDEVDGLRRKLSQKLSPAIPAYQPVWDVSDLLATWCRPDFDNVQYPYAPPHVTKPKEEHKVFVCPLSERCNFAVPSDKKLLAVPLFELYGNAERYGPVIAAIPTLLSRYSMVYH